MCNSFLFQVLKKKKKKTPNIASATFLCTCKAVETHILLQSAFVFFHFFLVHTHKKKRKAKSGERTSQHCPPHTVTMHTPSYFLLLTIFSKQHSMTHFCCSQNLYICLLSFLRSQNPHGGLLNHFYCCFSFSGLIKVAVSEEGICSMPPSTINSDSDSKPLYWKVTNPTLSPSHLQGK